MCDYSLDFVASRPAKVGDKLITAEFSGAITRGFTAVGEPEVAICLLLGTELAFEKAVEYEPRFHLFHPSRKTEGKVAQFRQVDSDQLYAHHDALEFPDGQTMSRALLKMRSGRCGSYNTSSYCFVKYLFVRVV